MDQIKCKEKYSKEQLIAWHYIPCILKNFIPTFPSLDSSHQPEELSAWFLFFLLLWDTVDHVTLWPIPFLLSQHTNITELWESFWHSTPSKTTAQVTMVIVWYGIQGHIQNWISSFLWSQCASITSFKCSVLSGVPQVVA